MQEEKKAKRRWLNSSLRRESVFYILLVAISLTAPLISYAGISLIYPSSTITSSVAATPPIRWASGTDYASAQTLGFAGSFTTTNNAASFTLTVSGLSGGSVTIDYLLTLNAPTGITSYKMKIATALAGSLSPAPTTLKLRFWTGATPPTADGSAGVVAVLDLTSALNTETTGTISGGATTVNVQLVYVLQSSTTGSSTVSIQPSSIVTT